MCDFHTDLPPLDADEYRLDPDEEFYRAGAGRLESLRRRPLAPGDFYRLLPALERRHEVLAADPRRQRWLTADCDFLDLVRLRGLGGRGP